MIEKIEQSSKKQHVPDIQTGDTVRVHQEISEGSKTRIQVFEGTVIRTRRKNSLTYNITVRRIASGVGVEKTFMLHAPNVKKIEITKRTKVRRNYLSYLRERQGKSARLAERSFDQEAVNAVPETKADSEPEEPSEKDETPEQTDESK